MASHHGDRTELGRQETFEAAADGDPGQALVRRQRVYREVNNHIERLTDDLQLAGSVVLFCECSNAGCEEQIELTDVVHAAFGRRPDCFILKLGHDNPEIERVVETHPTYLLTETRRDTVIDVPVAVELSGPSFRSELRQLGSLSERWGMRMYLDEPLSASGGRARVSIFVPRARTRREAEEVVAWMLEWIPAESSFQVLVGVSGRARHRRRTRSPGSSRSQD